MIENIPVKKLSEKLHKDNPFWSLEGCEKQASEYLSLWDSRFEKLLNDYLDHNIETDYKYEEFSVFLIKALRHNCSYLTALNLMNEYIMDPLNGKAQILRR